MDGEVEKHLVAEIDGAARAGWTAARRRRDDAAVLARDMIDVVNEV